MKCQNFSENKQKCQICQRLCMLRCPVCKVNYCSSECQKKDWITHKPNCKPTIYIVYNTHDIIKDYDGFGWIDYASLNKEKCEAWMKENIKYNTSRWNVLNAKPLGFRKIDIKKIYYFPTTLFSAPKLFIEEKDAWEHYKTEKVEMDNFFSVYLDDIDPPRDNNGLSYQRMMHRGNPNKLPEILEKMKQMHDRKRPSFNGIEIYDPGPALAMPNIAMPFNEVHFDPKFNKRY